MVVGGRRHNTDDVIATVLAVEPMKFIYRGRCVLHVCASRACVFYYLRVQSCTSVVFAAEYQMLCLLS